MFSGKFSLKYRVGVCIKRQVLSEVRYFDKKVLKIPHRSLYEEISFELRAVFL